MPVHAQFFKKTVFFGICFQILKNSSLSPNPGKLRLSRARLESCYGSKRIYTGYLLLFTY